MLPGEDKGNRKAGASAYFNLHKEQSPGDDRETDRMFSDRQEVLHIAVAEDDQAMRHLLSYFLRAQGYEVVECTSGSDLCAVIHSSTQSSRTDKIDLVVSDIHMPGPSGIECLNISRRLHLNIPFIFVTGSDDQEIYERAMDAGASVVFLKPLDLETLLSAVNRTLVHH